MVVPSSDHDYFDAIRRVRESTKLPIYQADAGGWTINAQEFNSDPKLVAVLAERGRVFPTIRFQFSDGNGPTVTVSRHSLEKSLFDKVTVSGGAHDPVIQAKLIAAAQKHFGTMAADYVGDLVGPGGRAQLEAREVAISKLEKLAADLMYEMEDTRKKRDAELVAREQALEATYKAKSAKLDEEHQTRTNKQDARDAELDDKKKQLEDASAKDQRRKDFQKIKDKFTKWAETFTVTTGTMAERKAVRFNLTLFVSFVGAVSVFLTGPLVFGYGQDNVYLMVARSASWILFVSTALFFIRWDNAWFQRLANEEFRLKRVELDIERANWMIETASEWKEDKLELPAELLTRMSIGLFADGKDEQPVEHTADVLARTLANASSLKIGPGGTEMTWNAKDLNKPL